MPSTNLPDIITTMDFVISSEQPTSYTTVVNQIEKFENHSYPEPIEYETNGQSLGNTIYYYPNLASRFSGYISSVSFRLFTNWEDTTSLYIFVISGVMFDHSITYRYAIKPQQNTTQWQTIKIPSRTLPIVYNNYLAVGMQDSSNTSQIYVVKSTIGMGGIDVNETTTKINLKIGFQMAPAFIYTVVYYDQTLSL
ncbi:unnamed protein product [Rotaria sp. Silwood2]|nr:unnamed protein product [Rotaria sp. Silwood2]CAF2962782.1 unnamed protein product [Rotaria sp. Silwood2]CAF3227703.1 unnamed protein product [Rotaria sp. Silwood2]CAF3391552.1 unnamed protein product [Rotaria sp. Silwood2]